ncbi:MAG: hypothetical protein JXR49_22255 [Acidobacteria bacterium]|nr:hypothetical protein [Acidobacteriota bacterium]
MLFLEPGDTIYWHKNGHVHLFNNQIHIFPHLDPNDSDMWATTICLYYNQSKLRKLTFQLWTDNRSIKYIEIFAFDFLEKFKIVFGKPTVDNQRNNNFWTFKDSIFGCKISPDLKNIWFSWVIR